MIQELLDKIKNHQFLYYKVTRNFCTISNFTDADIKFEVSKQEMGSGKVAHCSIFEDLFDLSNIRLPSDVTTFLARDTPWTDLKSKYEKYTLVHLAETVLIHLFGTVTFEAATYASLIAGKNQMEAKTIGIGSSTTLHGIPDMRVDELLYVYMPEASEEAEEGQEGNEGASSGFGSNGKDTNKCVSLKD